MQIKRLSVNWLFKSATTTKIQQEHLSLQNYEQANLRISLDDQRRKHSENC